MHALLLLVVIVLPAGGGAIHADMASAGGGFSAPEEDPLSTASPGLTSCTLHVAEGIEPVLVSVYWTTGDDLPSGFASAHTVMTAPLSGGEGDRFDVDTRFHADLDPSGWFVAEDMDFDGTTDFRLMESPTAGPDTYWLFWLYDPASGRFRRASDWESLGLVSPAFDAGERTIQTFSRGGYGYYTLTLFTVEDGFPAPVRVERTEWDQDDRLIKITLERVDGVLTETGRESMNE